MLNRIAVKVGTYAPSRYMESARVQLPGGGAPTGGAVSRLETLDQIPGFGAHDAPGAAQTGSDDCGETPRLTTDGKTASESSPCAPSAAAAATCIRAKIISVTKQKATRNPVRNSVGT